MSAGDGSGVGVGTSVTTILPNVAVALRADRRKPGNWSQRAALREVEMQR
jgi:hypothetical protein